MKANPKWAQSLEPQIQQAQEELRLREPRLIAELSETEFIQRAPDHHEFRVRFFERLYTVSWPELIVYDSQGQACSNPTQATLLQYLLLADGAPLENRWVSLRELPHGAFYERAFQSYSGNLLARTFKSDVQALSEAARRLGGERLSLGDLSFRFRALPKIPLAVVYWSGGEEFPASAQVLFDASAGHYHHLEMLAHLGALICDRLIQVSRVSEETR